jgi:hypothetical protein
MRRGKNDDFSFLLELVEKANEEYITINGLKISPKFEKSLFQGRAIPSVGDNPEIFSLFINKKKYIVVRFSMQGCTGFSCLRTFFLIVDEENRKHEFLERLVGFDESLFSFIDHNNDGNLDFIQVGLQKENNSGLRDFFLEIKNVFGGTSENFPSYIIQETSDSFGRESLKLKPR